MAVLKQAENGVPVSELYRERGSQEGQKLIYWINFPTYQRKLYKWRPKFGGLDASLIADMQGMAEQDRRLKKIYADMSMQNDLLNEAAGNKG